MPSDVRVLFIAGNWKMHKTVSETVKFAEELRVRVEHISDVEIVIAPPFTALWAAAEVTHDSNVGIAAQDLHWEREGAFTGEVSGAMVREAGADYVIVGHSERRTLFGETDVIVNRKTHAAFSLGLEPIVCIGETLDQRDRGETFDVLDRQIKHGLDRITADQVEKLVIAYEPVWAIGTGRNATPAQASEAHGHIRQRLRQWFGGQASELCHVIYGGSVKPENAGELVSQPDVDGALVGGASLDINGFVEIVSRSRDARARLV